MSLLLLSLLLTLTFGQKELVLTSNVVCNSSSTSSASSLNILDTINSLSPTLFSAGGQLFGTDPPQDECINAFESITSSKVFSLAANDLSLGDNRTDFADRLPSYITAEENNNHFEQCGDYVRVMEDLWFIVLASLVPNVRPQSDECNVTRYLEEQLSNASDANVSVVIIGSDPPTIRSDSTSCTPSTTTTDVAPACTYSFTDSSFNSAYAAVIEKYSSIIVFQAFGASSGTTFSFFSFIAPATMQVPMFLLPSLGLSDSNQPIALLRVTLSDSNELQEVIVRHYPDPDNITDVLELDVMDELGMANFSVVQLRNASARLFNDEPIGTDTQEDIYLRLIGGGATCDPCTDLPLTSAEGRKRLACATFFTTFEDWSECLGLDMITAELVTGEPIINTTDSGPAIEPQSGRLSAGAIVAIAIGGSVFVIAMVLIILAILSFTEFFSNRREKLARRSQPDNNDQQSISDNANEPNETNDESV